ncbi:MAG TPA: polymer-forming cytoskeletal protein [Alphaproteobacteria bacterium]
MFKKVESKLRPDGRSLSIIAADMKLVGDVTSEGEIQIDGHVEGDVRCGSITVGQSGVIKGAVRADGALVRGRITGEISARSVSLTKTAHVLGDVLHESLTVEPGAYIDGHCRRLDKPAQGGLNLVVSDITALKRG